MFCKNMLTNLKRILKFSWQKISRNRGLSLQVVFIMVVAIFVLTFLFIFNSLSEFLIARAQEKVDISVYFKKEVSEEQIFDIREELFKFSREIESINYVSKERAQEIFIQRHQNDPLYLAALNEVGANPFLASLNIKASSPVFYAEISSFLTEGPFQKFIEKVSYYQSKKVIDRLFAWIGIIENGGIFLGVFLIVLVFLITFNTVKLTISANQDEIATMRLVGASNMFIRGPFLIQGFLYAVFSLLIVDILLFVILGFLSDGLQAWLFEFNLLEYFRGNFLVILLWQLVFSFFLGAFSSWVAVRKYLKV